MSYRSFACLPAALISTLNVSLGGQPSQRLSVNITGRTLLQLAVAGGATPPTSTTPTGANAALTCS